MFIKWWIVVNSPISHNGDKKEKLQDQVSILGITYGLSFHSKFNPFFGLSSYSLLIINIYTHTYVKG
jgi:hypothetical protein